MLVVEVKWQHSANGLLKSWFLSIIYNVIPWGWYSFFAEINSHFLTNMTIDFYQGVYSTFSYLTIRITKQLTNIGHKLGNRKTWSTKTMEVIEKYFQLILLLLFFWLKKKEYWLFQCFYGMHMWLWSALLKTLQVYFSQIYCKRRPM